VIQPAAATKSNNGATASLGGPKTHTFENFDTSKVLISKQLDYIGSYFATQARNSRVRSVMSIEKDKTKRKFLPD